MLSDELKAALQQEHYEHGPCRHKDHAHCYHLMIAGALWRSDLELDGEDDYDLALSILVDETLNGLILKGYMEPAGIDEDGEFTYGLTDKGKALNEDEPVAPPSE